tara:strand:- start:1503 stop:3320 length:1818 start_codon:yes stop_codon:yes gene_type:complete
MAYEQDIKVQYGSFIFPVPTPYVSKSFTNQFLGGDLWATAVEITLTGQVALLPKRSGDEAAGANVKYEKLSKKRDEVAAAFAGALSKNFQKFTVSGHDTVFELNNCVVQSVNFDSSTYVGLLSYTIVLSGFKNDKDFYTANYGISNPVDSWNYSEGGDGVATATHSVSATGYNTNENGYTNAFANAKSFVDSKKGTSNKVAQQIIRNAHTDSSLILTSVSEDINRLAGTYSITENYSFVNNEASSSAGEEANLPSMQTANVLLTYSLSFEDQSNSEFVTVNLSGNLTGSQEDSVTWNMVKADFKSRKFYDLVNKAYLRHIKGTVGSRQAIEDNLELNRDPVSFTITPNEEAKTIGFEAVYDNNNLFSQAKIKNANSYFDYNISFNHDNIADIITVQCSGAIRTRGSLTKKNRDNKILLDLMVADDCKIVRDEAQKAYYKMFPTRTQYVLSPKPNSITIDQNKFAGTIQFSLGLTDDDFPENSSLREAGYSVSVSPPTQIYKPVPSALQNGHYLVYDLKLQTQREEVGVNCRGGTDDRNTETFDSAKAEVKSINDFLINSFVTGNVKRLESQNKVENKDTGDITYRRNLSHERASVVIDLDRLDTG